MVDRPVLEYDPIITKNAVMDLQELLNEMMGCHLKVDGRFGFETERKVIGFNERHVGTSSAIVGPKTWAALGMVDESPPDLDEDITDTFSMAPMRQMLLRYQALMWAGAPLFGAIQIWGQIRNHPLHGAGWIGPAIIAAIFIPIWLLFGKLFLAFRTIFAEQDHDEERARLARVAQRELTIHKAERLRTAKARLAKIQASKQAAENAEMAADIDRIRRSLDTDSENDDGP